MNAILLLEWKEDYNVGDRLIDSQHQYLFELGNKVLATATLAECDKAVLELFKYTREHFSAEEDLMAARHYAGLDHQRVSHNELLRRLIGLVDTRKGHLGEYYSGLYALMVDWVLRHILEEDTDIPLGKI